MELKEIAPYLPYGIKAQSQFGNGDYDYKGYIADIGFTKARMVDGNKWKLILRPLSDLTKSCLPDGKIPIVELAKMAYPMHEDWRVYLEDYDKVKSMESAISDEGGWFEYVHSSFWRNDDGVLNQLQFFQKLFEWHFDVFELIENGEAIDINSLP